MIAPIIVGVPREERREVFRNTPMIVSWTKSR
jgi:hypothetical protein